MRHCRFLPATSSPICPGAAGATSLPVMKNKDHDFVGTHIPINNITALVVSKGEHYEPEIKNKNIIISDIQLPVRNPKPSELSNKKFTNLKGHVYGRFTVIGISADKPKRWVVRCACGLYVIRTTKAIKKATAEEHDRCQRCLYIKGFSSRNRRYNKWIDHGALKRELGEK